MVKYCIVEKAEKILSFLLDENGHALEIHADSREEQKALLGNIYVGKVQKVAKNLNAAFVQISPGQVCYLPLEEVKGDLRQGDELVVQISREGIRSKGPAVTVRLCLAGKYVILDEAKSGVGVSRKLDEEIRSELKRSLTAYWEKVPESIGTGIVVRTNAGAAGEAAVLGELESLVRTLREIRERAAHRTCYSCLRRSPQPWLRRLSGLPIADLSRITVEDESLHAEAEAYLREHMPELLPKLSLYQDRLLAMDKLYSLERELEGALGERVWLKSGAYLVIQPTEALTVVDVNSGKNEAGRKKEEAILKINLEAARETARQMRLRNLSGIILVDFINMEQEESREQVMEALREQLRRDPVQAHVVDITKLNLVELTRKKVERPLAEQIK